MLGVGIDENTALLVQPGKSLEVIGEGAITILDARNTASSNVSRISRDDLLTVFGIQLHMIASGSRYVLEANRDFGKADLVSCLVERLANASQ